MDWLWRSWREDSSPWISSPRRSPVLVDPGEDPHQLVLSEVLEALDRGLAHLRDDREAEGAGEDQRQHVGPGRPRGAGQEQAPPGPARVLDRSRCALVVRGLVDLGILGGRGGDVSIPGVDDRPLVGRRLGLDVLDVLEHLDIVGPSGLDTVRLVVGLVLPLLGLVDLVLLGLLALALLGLVEIVLDGPGIVGLCRVRLPLVGLCLVRLPLVAGSGSVGSPSSSGSGSVGSPSSSGSGSVGSPSSGSPSSDSASTSSTGSASSVARASAGGPSSSTPSPSTGLSSPSPASTLSSGTAASSASASSATGSATTGCATTGCPDEGRWRALRRRLRGVMR